MLLLLTLFAGCATRQVGATPGSHLENYHKVYFVWTDYDPRKVSPRVVTRLKQTGFEVADITTNKFSIDGAGTEFQHIQIEFFDSQNGDLVYFAKKYQYEPVVSENAELNRLFVKISDDFSPGQPNPFKSRK